jgi:hypothetical protein
MFDKAMPGMDVAKAAAPRVAAFTKSRLCILSFPIILNIRFIKYLKSSTVR